jgi:hypothetical protein
MPLSDELSCERFGVRRLARGGGTGDSENGTSVAGRKRDSTTEGGSGVEANHSRSLDLDPHLGEVALMLGGDETAGDRAVTFQLQGLRRFGEPEAERGH